MPCQNTSLEYLATQNTSPHRIPHHTEYLATQNTSHHTVVSSLHGPGVLSAVLLSYFGVGCIASVFVAFCTSDSLEPRLALEEDRISQGPVAVLWEKTQQFWNMGTDEGQHVPLSPIITVAKDHPYRNFVDQMEAEQYHAAVRQLEETIRVVKKLKWTRFLSRIWLCRLFDRDDTSDYCAVHHWEARRIVENNNVYDEKNHHGFEIVGRLICRCPFYKIQDKNEEHCDLCILEVGYEDTNSVMIAGSLHGHPLFYMNDFSFGSSQRRKLDHFVDIHQDTRPLHVIREMRTLLLREICACRACDCDGQQWVVLSEQHKGR
jgi:hypothetical protein